MTSFSKENVKWENIFIQEEVEIKLNDVKDDEINEEDGQDDIVSSFLIILFILIKNYYN